MTDEEKAEEYVLYIPDTVDAKHSVYSEEKLKQAYLDGLAEGRKELEKENEELKAELNDIKTAIRNYSKAETYQQQEITWNSLLEFIN